MNCGNGQRRGVACDRCGVAVHSVELTHSSYGVAMWILTALGGVFVPLAFVGVPLLIFVGLGMLVSALGLNVADDRALDGVARRRAQELAAGVARHPTCGTALAIHPTAGQAYCPRCLVWMGPASAPLPPPPPP